MCKRPGQWTLRVADLLELACIEVARIVYEYFNAVEVFDRGLRGGFSGMRVGDVRVTSLVCQFSPA